ncbi:multidrug resistance efflux pump [Bradyrhizobium sp. LM6.11]
MSEMPRTENFQQATEITHDNPKVPLPVPARNIVRRAALVLALLAGTAAIVHYGHDYWTTGRYLETTDDAYVKADSTIIAPKVSGYIAKVLVSDNEKVKAGQVLAKIDGRDFKAALDQARADVAAAEASVRNLDAQLELQQPIIEQSTADVTAADANLKFAQEERARYDDLMKSGSGTIQRAQQTDAALRASNAQLQHAKSGLVAAQRKIDVLTTQRAQATAQLEHARAVAEQATLNLSYTEIAAPVDGTVGARSLRVGQFVQAGTQLMAVVPLDAVYVVANFNGDPAHPCSRRPAGRTACRQFPQPDPARPCRQPVAGERPRIRTAAARQRHREFHQDRAARTGEDRARRPPPDRAAAPRYVGAADSRHQGDRAGRARDGQAPRRQCDATQRRLKANSGSIIKSCRTILPTLARLSKTLA